MFILKNVKYKNILHIENMTIQNGKVTCIIGESGSGKTTILKMLNKMISPDSGEILFKDKKLNETDSVAIRRNVVMLPQSPSIFKGNIKNNLLIGLDFSEKPAASDIELKEVLKVVKLNKDLDDSADKLSGGEKQRVALGRILLMDPEVLLLDEPSSALDEETENIIFEALVDYTKKFNKTLIMVTHSRQVAEKFSDEIIAIKNGKIYNREEQ